MPGFFYNLGRLAAPKVRKAKWVWRSLTGTEVEALAAEHAAGRDMADAVLSEFEPDPDEAPGQLLNELLGRLTNCLTKQNRQFAVRLVRSAEANAFALPGGFLFVTRPLVELCQSEPNELAFILGHEIAHVVHKHALDRMLSSSISDALLRSIPIAGLLRSQFAGVLRQLLQSGYSQDQELDADEFGLRLSRAAGFDTAAAAQMLARLRDRSGDPLELLAYFASHPPFDVRIRRLTKLGG